MQLLNQIVKTSGHAYLKVKAQQLPQSRRQLVDQQEKLFQKFKSRLKGTRIYNDMHLEMITGYRDYVNQVPVYEYDFYAPYVDMICAGHEDILFKGKPVYFGLSSGTSGKDSKRVPYNEDMINVFLNGQRQVASRLCFLETDLNVLNADRLAFGSSPKVYEENGIPFGYISGILSTRTPKMLKEQTYPSDEVLAVSDWNRKIDMLIEEALSKDIQIVSGIPTYIISIFEAVLEKTGKKYIREIWPNLQLFVYAATPIKQYKERIDNLIGRTIQYYGLYAATEAPIGLPYSSFDITQRYLLNPDLLYSFTSVENPADVRGIHNLKLGEPYSLNIGTPNGFVHYAMKDTIMFTEHNGHLVFEFVGRKSVAMNMAAEKVSETQILDTVIRLKNELNQDIKHFFVSPGSKNNKPAYCWTLFMNLEDQPNAEIISEKVDQILREINPDYNDCREVNVIEKPYVNLMNASSLHGYFERNRDKGQFKMKTTFNTQAEFDEFMNKNFMEH